MLCYSHIQFHVKRRPNFFFSIKIDLTNANNCALSNSAIKLKMVELIVSINWQTVGQIAIYAGKLLMIFKNVSL